MLAENMAQEIRDFEEAAKKIVADAKAEAGKMLAAAQVDSEQAVKKTKQECHRQWRESIAAAEKEAEDKAVELLRKGKEEADAFYEKEKASVKAAADWLVKEVMTTYGTR